MCEGWRKPIYLFHHCFLKCGQYSARQYLWRAAPNHWFSTETCSNTYPSCLYCQILLLNIIFLVQWFVCIKMQYCVFCAAALLWPKNHAKYTHKKGQTRPTVVGYCEMTPLGHAGYYCGHTDIKYVTFCVLWFHTFFAVTLYHFWYLRCGQKICSIKKQKEQGNDRLYW